MAIGRLAGFICSSSVLVLVVACSSAPPDGVALHDAPTPTVLHVPALESFADSPVRALSGQFVQTTWDALPGWQTDALEHVWAGVINNCKGLMRPVSGSTALPPRASPRVWQPVCAQAWALDQTGTPDVAQVRRFLEQHLQPWRLLDTAGAPAFNTVTGYYEPLVHAAMTRHGAYQWPLYGVPQDLLHIDLGQVYPELAGKRVRGKLQGQRVVPYDTRAQIAASATPPPVLVWANDPVEAFFLQIQGSGRAQLPDGSMMRLAYADHNGRPYRSIGRWLVEQGELALEQASMQSIKLWAQRNPSRVLDMLHVNTAMVFFRGERIAAPNLGPRGSYGVPLIPMRAIAVDPQFVPLGSPVWLATQWPYTTQPLQRLVFAQDTGAAIKGAGRADFYWGFGDQAAEQAGRMKQEGALWLLWPRAAGSPDAR